MHGKGKFIFTEEGMQYEGDYVEDMKEGEGVLRFADGRVYNGSWKRGKMHGLARFKFSEEEEFKKGEWVDGKRIRWIK